jgi:hypothetical protein
VPQHIFSGEGDVDCQGEREGVLGHLRGSRTHGPVHRDAEEGNAGSINAGEYSNGTNLNLSNGEQPTQKMYVSYNLLHLNDNSYVLPSFTVGG